MSTARSWRLGRRRGFEPWIELCRPVESGKLLIAADMRPIDEDLRHGAAPRGAGDHLLAQGRIEADIDLDEGLAFPGQEPLGRVAIAAKWRSVEHDPAHSVGLVFLIEVPLL